jgi:hypothetical protein
MMKSATMKLTVSKRTLRVLAAVVWHIGGLVLLLKGRSLLLEADALQPGSFTVWLVIAAGLMFGGLKARFLFRRSCRKNLKRIAALEQPRIWQFFRPGFFVALGLMIAAGATLSRLAHDNYQLLLGVGLLDLSLAVALLSSGLVFWRRRSLSPATVTG